jgi:hypothetical protein
VLGDLVILLLVLAAMVISGAAMLSGPGAGPHGRGHGRRLR